jgi:hypothetical protein
MKEKVSSKKQCVYAITFMVAGTWLLVAHVNSHTNAAPA